MIIQSGRELAAFCERVKNESVICVDTEFASEGRYYAELGTIQVAAGDELALIDAIAIPDVSSLAPLLSDAAIVKVFHAGEQDLEILCRLLGRPVAPVFDTQIAAAFLGYGDQISLRSLVQTTLCEQIAKEHTFTDWLRRPLSSSQVEYALNDVRYLGRVYDVLKGLLVAAGRLEWVHDEFRLLEKPERFAPIDEREAYTKVPGAARLSKSALGVLQELAAWREVTARQWNIPAKRVVIDPVLTGLAMRPVKSVSQLAALRGMNRRQVEQFGPEIIEALRRGATNVAPPMERVESFPAEIEATVDFLSLCMRSVAQEQSISTGTLGNRTDLRLLAMLGETADIRLLRGWRRQMLGEALLGALLGQVTASIDAGSRAVRLRWASQTGEDVTCSPALQDGSGLSGSSAESV